MKQNVFLEAPDKINKLLQSNREARFSLGLGCVHLVAQMLNGTCNQQRYLCKDLGGNIAFDKRVKQMHISACQRCNDINIVKAKGVDY